MIKKIIWFVFIGVLFLLQGCYEDYKTDFEYTTTYFARQFPLRTLVDEDDKEMMFKIGAVLGGKYSNNTNEEVNFIIQDTLLNGYPDLIQLPKSYYTMESNNAIIIPKGTFKGDVKITLDKEKFMNDALAVGKNYVLPLQITEASTDSILKDKHYSMIVLRYYNKYHGWYYLKGVDNELDINGNIVGSEVYSVKDLTKNEDMLLETISKDEILIPYIGRFFNDNNDYTMHIKINDEKATLKAGNQTGSLTNIDGTGSYNSSDRKFTLKYNYTDTDGIVHSVLDTLYYRNTELVLEDWQ